MRHSGAMPNGNFNGPRFRFRNFSPSLLYSRLPPAVKAIGIIFDAHDGEEDMVKPTLGVFVRSTISLGLRSMDCVASRRSPSTLKARLRSAWRRTLLILNMLDSIG